jgi:hypothetical protein
MTANNRNLLAQIDYDLHGLAGVRLLDAMPGDAGVVTRQLGLIQGTLAREPDIVIRFVDQLPISSKIRYLGLDNAGFTHDAFLVLRSKHKSRAKVQIPFEQIGRQCQIVCERGLSAVPLLIPILNLTVLSKGALPLHASAFTYDGTGVLTTGWAKGGKTETLLAFMANGARYVGDEWVYLSDDGQRMYGIPEPIRLWNWHFRELPQYWALVGKGDRARLKVLNSLIQLMDRVVLSGMGRGFGPVKLMERLIPPLKRQLYVQLPPQRLFGQGVGPLVGTPEKIFFVASHEAPDITIQPIDSQEIAQRMVFSLQAEQMDFMSYYLKFRFAFPETPNGLIERAEELQREILTRVLAGKDTYAVYHPYPLSIPALFEVIRPFCK